MGGVVDSGVGIDTKPSLCRAAIEKAQAELRLEYDVREERRRELEFLEKGGDPLDFKFGQAASGSVQSTSHTDQHPCQNLTSDAKGSFALTASPPGDSVESSGQLGVTIAGEPNSADNFDGENEILESDRKLLRHDRSSFPLSEHSQFITSGNNKDSEESPIFHPKKGQAYRRRNRYRTNRDGSRSSFAELATREGHGSSVPVRHEMLFKPVASKNQFEMESVGTHAMPSATSRVTEFAEGKINLLNSKEKLEEVQNLSLQVDEASVTIRTVEPAIVVGTDSINNVDVQCPPSGAMKTEVNATLAQLNVTRKVNGDEKFIPTDAVINNVSIMTKGLDSESPCTQTNVSVDGNANIDSELHMTLNNVDNNGAPKDDKVLVGKNLSSQNDKMASEDATIAVDNASCIKEDRSSISHQVNGFTKDHAEVDRSKSSLQDEVEGLSNVEGQEKNNNAVLISEKELCQLGDPVPEKESSFHVRSLVDAVSNEFNKDVFSGPSPVSQPCTENRPKSLDKAQDDMILEEALTIEAKRKQIAKLSIGLSSKSPSVRELHRHKCHWDLVLEEMAWLANDFAQERLWKMRAAAHICRRAAFASRIRFEEQSNLSKPKNVARTLAKAVMEFWYEARLSVENADNSNAEKCKYDTLSGAHEKDKMSQDGLQSTRRKQDQGVYGYAVRFLQFNCSVKALVEVEVPGITDVAWYNELTEVSWHDQFIEENLFYAVPPGSMETYRYSIESCLAESERIHNNVQEEVVTSAHVAAAERGYEDNDYEEDEGEGENLYYQPSALDTGKLSKKKLKNMKSHAARSFEFEGDFGYGNCAETRNGTVQLNIIGKRPATNLHVDPIPTKRMRTASRQRVVGPFTAVPAGVTPLSSRADTSSEDTNSFQDDQSFPHGGSVVPRGSEVVSTMNFKKQSRYDSIDIPAKPNKRKKTKHQSLSYDQRWRLESSMQNDQKDLVRKRLDNHQLESNGNGGLFSQHAKKPKLAKHLLDNSFDNTAPMSGSVASPVASQMSNLSSQTKMIKFIGGRDRGKKGKGLKVSTGQFGSGSPWTIVEDQALVVLVHDMGPNWELVSDAINSILQFKCIFHKPQECKERHKFLMDRPSGDGADSAEDSGSSQPYPSTLPGIPKGSARQLFRSLHAHVEEDNIKSLFEKIIRIEQQLHIRKKKNDNQDLKKIAPAHSSHILSLSQVIPNNVNGGVLTPLELCDTVASNQDPTIDYKSSHTGGLSLPNQTSIPHMHPPGGLTLPFQGLQSSPGMSIGNNLASPLSQLTSARDARYAVPRSGSLPSEEQQRLHQYNSMPPGRNIQASNVSSSGSPSCSDRNVRMHPGGNGVTVMPGMNRSLPMARAGVQGISSSSMLNSGSVLASNVGEMPTKINVHSGTASGHGNTVFRHRDSLPNVRSGLSSEHHRKMILPEMQIPAAQTNSPGFSNNQTTSPLQTYPGHHHSHVLNSPHPHLSTDQQAYICVPRDKQMQQRLLQQRQHQQHAVSSNALMTHVQTPSQPIPLSSPTPSSPITHVGPVPHQQQKNVQGLGGSAQCCSGGMSNKGAKQRQRLAQQHQQSGRQHPQSEQVPKLVKGIGRGGMVIHQNLPIDPSHLNGLNSANSTTQNILPPSKPLASPPTSNQTQPKKQPSVSKGVATSKPVQKISSHIDGGNQGQTLSSNQGPKVVLSRNHQQLQRQPSLKVVNRSQPALQRTSQQNRQVNSDLLTKSPVDSGSNVMVLEKQSSGNSGSSTIQAVTNSPSTEPLSPVNKVLMVEKQSSGNILVSRGLEAQRQHRELPQKQSQIQGGQSVVFTGTTNSRSD